MKRILQNFPIESILSISSILEKKIYISLIKPPRLMRETNNPLSLNCSKNNSPSNSLPNSPREQNNKQSEITLIEIFNIYSNK